MRELEAKVRAEHFALVQIQMGPFTRPEMAPLIAGEPKPLDRLEALATQEKFSTDELARLRESYAELARSSGGDLQEGCAPSSAS